MGIISTNSMLARLKVESGVGNCSMRRLEQEATPKDYEASLRRLLYAGTTRWSGPPRKRPIRGQKQQGDLEETPFLHRGAHRAKRAEAMPQGMLNEMRCSAKSRDPGAVQDEAAAHGRSC